MWRVMVHTYLSVIGDTGTELSLQDECQLLEKMASDPEYIEPLQEFEHRTLVSVVHCDTSVPFASSSIRCENPYKIPESGPPAFRVVGYDGFGEDYLKLFSEKPVSFDPKYEGIENGNGWKSDSARHLEFSDKMRKNLCKINWRRIDVEFTFDYSHKTFTMHDLIVGKGGPTGFLVDEGLKKAGKEFQMLLKEIYTLDLCK